jgi:hypothetical protein
LKILKVILAACFFAVLAKAQVIPIVEMRIGGLLGGIENGKFLDAKTTAVKLAAEQKYKLYLANGKFENLLIKKPSPNPDMCEDFFSLEAIELKDEEKRATKGGVAIGEGFNWNPLPRPLKMLGLNNAADKKIMRDFLRTQKMNVPVARLNQAIRADLDGDGQEEIILSETRAFSGEESQRPKNGYDEYSFVLIRKITGGKPKNILVAGEFIPGNGFEFPVSNYTVSAIADLNGDGKMEIVLHSQYELGNETKVFEMVGSNAVEVKTLSVECGG